MQITVFESLTKKEAHGVIDAALWIKAIRDGKYKPTVDRVRTMIQHGDKDGARDLKMKLPASVWAGDCRTGRFFKNTRNRTGCFTLDFDNLLEEQLLAARQLLEVFPWIVAVHVTASGRGLRVIVNGGIVHIDVYRTAYETVAQRLRDITGLDPDMACKDFARASLASYDPDAYYNPDAEVFPYESGSNPLNYEPASGPDPSEDFRYLKNPINQNRTAEQRPENVTDPDYVINQFFSKYPYVEGSRTNTMLFLGKYLRWFGIQPWQLDGAITTACSRGVQPGITAREIERAIKWGYENGEEGEKNGSNQGHWGQRFTMAPNLTEVANKEVDNEEDKCDEEDESEIIKCQCPQFPDEIFETLPEEIKKLLSVVKDKKERDITLLGILTVSSTMFPALRTMYGNRKYSAHMYTFVVAEAGAGKSEAMNALNLARKTDKELDSIYKKAKKEFERKSIEWELELKYAMRDNRLPDMEKKPEAPARYTLITSPNTSKSQLIIDVWNAGEYGLIIICTEADSMVETLKTDYGNQAAELRMFFQHEEVRQRFKVDKEPIVIPHPHVAILLTGTPDQVVSLIRSTENGLFSRFLFYMLSDESVWKSQSPFDCSGNIDIEEQYGELAEMLKANFFSTMDRNIMINFTREQWDIHNQMFGAELGIVAAEDNNSAAAVVKRYGLITMRIAMVLCGYRIMSAGWGVSEYTCLDEDFNTALRIVLTCMKHANIVSTMMKKDVSRARIGNFYKLLPILDRMPDYFRFKDFHHAVLSAGFNSNAAKRSLKKYTAAGLLIKEDKLYKKSKKLKNRLK